MGEPQAIFDMSKAQPIHGAPLFDMSKAQPINKSSDTTAQDGAVTRFLTRATGLPVGDIIAHPKAYLDPFSSEYWQKGKEQNEAPPSLVTARQMIPFGQTAEDIKNKDYASAAGNIASGVVGLAPLLGGIEEGKPSVPTGIKAGIEAIRNGPPGTYPGASLPAKPTGIELNGIPNRYVPPEPAAALATPPPRAPVYPGARLPESPSPTLLQANSLMNGPKVVPPDPSAALRGIPVHGKIQGSELASIPNRYTPPDPASALSNIPVRAEAPEVAPVQVPEPLSKNSAGEGIPRTLSGESALRQVLGGQGADNLMKIAKSRGINVTQESQLKPGIAGPRLINKIIDDFDPEELDNFRENYLENTRMGAHNFGDIGPEAWKTLSLQTYFPDVKISNAVLKRTSNAIGNAAPKTATMADPADLTDILQQSLKKAKSTTQ